MSLKYLIPEPIRFPSGLHPVFVHSRSVPDQEVQLRGVITSCPYQQQSGMDPGIWQQGAGAGPGDSKRVLH